MPRFCVLGGSLDLLALLAVLLCGGGLVALGGWLANRALVPQLVSARLAERHATDRLVAAWKDGYAVPPRDAIGAPPPVDEDPLGPLTTDWLAQWDERGREAFEKRARSLRDRGMSDAQIVFELDKPAGFGAYAAEDAAA